MITFSNAKKKSKVLVATAFAGFMLVNGMQASAYESISVEGAPAAVAGAVYEQANIYKQEAQGTETFTAYSAASKNSIVMENSNEAKTIAVESGSHETNTVAIGGGEDPKSAEAEEAVTKDTEDVITKETNKDAEEAVTKAAPEDASAAKAEEAPAAKTEEASAEKAEEPATAKTEDASAEKAEEPVAAKAEDASEAKAEEPAVAEAVEAAAAKTEEVSAAKPEEPAAAEAVEAAAKETAATETVAEAATSVVYEVPEYSGNKSYESYRVIRRGKAGVLQTMATTNEDGFRMVHGRYLIAVGTYFGAGRGQYIDLTLENGTVIPCIVGDMKAAPIFSANGCCSEFIVDTGVIGNVINTGDVSDYRADWNSPVDTITVHNTFAL